MRPTLLAATAAFAVAIAVPIAAPSPAPAAQACATFAAGDAAVHTKVIRGRTTCTTARRVLHRYLTSRAACTGSACVRFVAGWTCATAAPDAFPRLASCVRRGAVIAAYSAAD